MYQVLALYTNYPTKSTQQPRGGTVTHVIQIHRKCILHHPTEKLTYKGTERLAQGHPPRRPSAAQAASCPWYSQAWEPGNFGSRASDTLNTYTFLTSSW